MIHLQINNCWKVANYFRKIFSIQTPIIYARVVTSTSFSEFVDLKKKNKDKKKIQKIEAK